MSIYDYIQQMASAVRARKSKDFQNLLTINPGHDAGLTRAKFDDPSDIDLYALPERFHPVARCYVKLMRSIYISSDLRASFTNINELLVCLNRAAESQTNWICAALINCSDELISIYQVRIKQFPQDDISAMEFSDSEVDIKKDTPLEVVASTINKSFKICLTDKNLDPSLSKRQSIHFFLAALLKIYFKLDKLQLAKSVEKALVATGYESPSPKNTPVHYRKYSVTYLYYSALLSLNDLDFTQAERKLSTAMDFLAYYRKPSVVSAQTEKILMLLIPLKMKNSGVCLKGIAWDTFPNLKFVFKDRLLLAIKRGDLQMFDHWLHKFQKIFLKRYIYILIVHLRTLCILRSFERSHRVYSTIETKTPHIVPFEIFKTALVISKSSEKSSSADGQSSANSTDNDHEIDGYGEIECLLANFIAKKLIKGYLSHSNKCIVLSKADPFPK